MLLDCDVWAAALEVTVMCGQWRPDLIEGEGCERLASDLAGLSGGHGLDSG